MIKVAKFGGTSLADAVQFKKVHDIVKDNEERRYVVVSAPGKRFKDDNKITDLLYLTHAHLKFSVPYAPVLKLIEDRFNEIKDELNLDIDLHSEFETIRNMLDNKCDEDYIVSRGEYLSAKLMASYLRCDFIDSKDVIFFKYDGTVDKKKTNEKLGAALSKSSKAIIPGFYGSYPDGSIKTFSRGGSDITGSIVASVAKADMYENWTDVSGFLMADPRIVKNPLPINKITYQELRELSYMGASVLHDEAVFPVRQAGIPINIRNTNEPDNPGTVIVGDDQVDEDYDNGHVITGIAGRKNFTFFYIHKEHMANEVGVVRKALEIFEERNISIDHIPSGIDSFSIVVPTECVEKTTHEIVEELKDKLGTDSVKTYKNLSLISTVGIRMAFRPGISAKLFNALGENNINIRMIDQGSSEINIIVGVDDKDFENAIRAIYNAFVK
ncbi:aspartate kinase [Sedimentibacter saalensis]|jgi:aspartate kinase|uniref:Aspartokinase n=1 Tax=Sedimentibacter saalensis TaxID=130788 RepID=A0A562JDZ3_9FIRM|nr:aspartate kinase [Sedimentibacter saalensis]MEA5094758.1 aspartate kinase [Sedimentibacter saalensis]TWH81382.1 aspartate kinase [Sedimentibacter saalensis]